MRKFLNREEAGRLLGVALSDYQNNENTLVLGLPRGGIPVAYEIASALHLPLDVFIVRKLGVPGQEELAMGAIASQDTLFFNEDIIQMLNISNSSIDWVIKQEKMELERREMTYRGKRPFP